MALSMETQLQNIFEDVVVKCIFIECRVAIVTEHQENLSLSIIGSHKHNGNNEFKILLLKYCYGTFILFAKDSKIFVNFHK